MKEEIAKMLLLRHHLDSKCLSTSGQHSLAPHGQQFIHALDNSPDKIRLALTTFDPKTTTQNREERMSAEHQPRQQYTEEITYNHPH